MESVAVGPFRLESLIGQGGMGQVWRGVHVGQQVPVAVKVLTREAARQEDYVASFRNEITSIARLLHPSIVVVLEHGELDERAEQQSGHQLVAGSPFIVMEYARSGSLHDYRAAMSWPELRAVLFTVLDALSHAHARDVIHRDLKPQNILLGCGPHDAIKLTDFGLAHLLDEERSGEVETGWGTPHYMAPEQFRGTWRDYGPWTDLYALGVMTFELASGYLPFVGKNAWDFGRAHITQEVPPLLPRFEVPLGLERWVLRLLQKEPAQRFQRAADAALALAELDRSFDAARRAARRTFMNAVVPSVALRTEEATAPLEAAGLEEVTSQGGAPVLDATLPIMDWVEPEAAQAPETLATLSSAPIGPMVCAPPPMPATWRRRHTPSLTYGLRDAGLGLYGLREARLVGREAELDAMWAALREAAAMGEARAVVLEGQAGMGKSRLASWLCDRVHELGCGTPLSATHSSVSQPGDGVAAMCLRHLRLNGLEPAARAERLERALERLALVDEHERGGLRGLLAGEGAMPQAQRHGLLTSFLAAVARERPLVIWLDDVHWSVEALMFARHILAARRVPALLVLTARAELMSPDALESMLLADLCAQPGVKRLGVGPLDAAPFTELVEELLGLEPALAQQVLERAGGVPLFAVQLVGDWVARGRLIATERGFTLHEQEPADIPDDLHKLWQGRLDRLFAQRSLAERVALEIAAALGQRVLHAEWQLAAQFRGVVASGALLAALLGAGLALPGEQGGWSFAHGMLRESLLREMREQGRWAQAHRACATMLEALYSRSGRRDDERLAHHLIEAGALEEALAPLREAIMRRLDHAELELAARLVAQKEALLHRLMSPEDDGRWGLCWELKARVLDMQGRSLEALRWALKARDAGLKHGWRDVTLLATLTSAEAALHRGGTDEAASSFDHVLQLLGGGQRTPLFVRAVMGAGRVAERRGELERAVELFTQALAVVELLGDEVARAACLNALGDVARQGQRWDAARGYAERSLELARRLGNKILEADSLNDLAELARRQGRLGEAVALCDQAARLYELVGSAQRLRVLLNLSFVHLMRQRYDEARVVLEPLIEQFSAAQEHSQLALAVVGMVPCYAAAREWDGVIYATSRARRLLEQTGRHDPDVALAATLALQLVQQDGGPEALVEPLDSLRADFGVER